MLPRIVLILIILTMVIWINHEAYLDDVRTLDTYCSEVKNGTWPDYNGIFSEACKDR